MMKLVCFLFSCLSARLGSTVTKGKQMIETKVSCDPVSDHNSETKGQLGSSQRSQQWNTRSVRIQSAVTTVKQKSFVIQSLLWLLLLQSSEMATVDAAGQLSTIRSALSSSSSVLPLRASLHAAWEIENGRVSDQRVDAQYISKFQPTLVNSIKLWLLWPG